MKNFSKLYLLAFCAAVLASCAEDAVDAYNMSKDNVYFNFSNPKNNRVLYSFADTTLNVVEVTLYLPVSVSGNRISRDRKFRVGLIDSLTTARAGIHYAPLNDEYVMPADSGTFRLPVTLYNKDEILTDTTLLLALQLTETNDFSVGFPHLISANIAFSSRLEEPDWWKYWLGELGLYSRTKHYLFLVSSGTKALSNPSSSDGYLYTPKALYHISEYKNFMNNPFTWTEKNTDYALDRQTDGTYLFYLKATPEKTYTLKWENSVGKYYFVDEKGGNIIV